jgi:hypothetical protein
MLASPLFSATIACMSANKPSNIPGVEFWSETSWVLCDDATAINYSDSRLSSIKGYTVDIENVLTDGIGGGDPEVRAEGIQMIQGIQELGKQVMLLTGCKDEDFVREAKRQINEETATPVEALYRGKLKDDKLWPGKHDPAMFYVASNRMRLAGRNMGHIDDQFKSHIGAVRAGYAVNIWTRSYGEHEHPGVAKFRPIEMSVVRALVRAYPRSRTFKPATS